MATMFKDNLSSGMNYLRRRFSSDDLYSERLSDDQDIQRLKINSNSSGVSPGGTGGAFPTPKRSNLPSAPSFPSFSSVQGMTKNLLSSAAESISGATQRVVINKERCKVLLVIDDRHTDWSRYFRGRRIFGDWDLRVEQAEFREISVAAFSDSGVVVEVQVVKNGNKIIQSFRPDFVLVRQHARNAMENWKHIVLALQYGGLPSVNSLHSVYNFLDKPWVFSHLIQIQRRLGRERFPLIDQAFYPNHREMMSNLWMVLPKLPVVVKIGHAHAGVGKVKVEDHYGFQDIASVMAVTDCYATTEPHIHTECDIYIQRIGSNYSAYMRKAMSGNWKANVGTSTLEPISMNDRYRFWVDECSQLFGGLDLLAVKAIRDTNGREYIIEVSDSTMALCGQDDFSIVADLVLSKVEVYCRPTPGSSTPASASAAVRGGPGLMGSSNQAQGQADPYSGHPRGPGSGSPGRGVQYSGAQAPMSGGGSIQNTPQRQLPQQPLNYTSNITPESRGPGGQAAAMRNSSQQQQYPLQQQQQQQQQRQQQQRPAVARPSGPASPSTIEAIARDLEAGEETDDTMNNLRKTFQGIFNNVNN